MGEDDLNPQSGTRAMLAMLIEILPVLKLKPNQSF
jgi:hypothetical protein